MGRIVHFEIAADDIQQAKGFYEGVFGWQFSKWGEEDYWLIKTGPDEEMGINGGLMRRDERFPSTVNTLGVASVDDAAERIAAHGGEIVFPKQAIPGMGYVAYFRDPSGVILGVFEHDPAATVPEPAPEDAAHA